MAALQIEVGGNLEPYGVTVGKTYLVLGLEFPKEPFFLLGNEGSITFTENGWYVLSAPLVMFDIIDPRVSAKWVMGRSQMGGLCLWPPLFFTPYFNDTLSSGDPELMKGFRRVYAELQEESGFKPTDDFG